jgi:transcriptional regulator, ArsR family
MSKAFETKEDILQRLKTKKSTVSELSKELGLSKATVSQHLKELTETGRVVEERNMHFKRTKYFGIKEHDYGTSKYAARYIIIAVIATAFVAYAALSLMHNSATVPTAPPVNTTPQIIAPPHATDCIMLPVYRTANYSSVNTVVSEIAHGNYCYLSYVNIIAHTIKIGNGISYSSNNGMLEISSLSYAYVLNSTDINNLKSQYSEGYCLAGKALEFFGVTYQPTNLTCKAVIYSDAGPTSRKMLWVHALQHL